MYSVRKMAGLYGTFVDSLCQVIFVRSLNIHLILTQSFMPIYEYIAFKSENSCSKCRFGFETVAKATDPHLTACPECKKKVKRLVSLCHAAVMDQSDANICVERQIKEHEKSGRWSHAAELADTHSEKTKDDSLKTRALDNYKKAGYDSGRLSKQDNP